MCAMAHEGGPSAVCVEQALFDFVGAEDLKTLFENKVGKVDRK